jgi:hypothetical protein
VAAVSRPHAGATSDLAWAPAGDEIRLNLSVTAGLSDIRFSGRVPIPTRAAGERLRLSVREFEIFETDESEKDDVLTRPFVGFETFVLRRPVKYRLVYADELAL